MLGTNVAKVAAASLGHKVIVVRASEQSNIEAAFTTLIAQWASALSIPARFEMFAGKCGGDVR
jgi:hypothetical protein